MDIAKSNDHIELSSGPGYVTVTEDITKYDVIGCKRCIGCHEYNIQVLRGGHFESELCADCMKAIKWAKEQMIKEEKKQNE